MSLTGDIQDVSVVDIIQFVHLSGRTGTLYLYRDDEKGVLLLHKGRIISAHAPNTKNIGDLLIERGAIDTGILEKAVRQQNLELPRRQLGQILVSSGAVSSETLRAALEHQIEQAVFTLVPWAHGRFEFKVDELTPPDDIGLDPKDIVPNLDLNTEMLLLEAMRIFDERAAQAKVEGPPAEKEPPPATQNGAAKDSRVAEASIEDIGEAGPHELTAVKDTVAAEYLVHLVTSDVDFGKRLTDALAEVNCEVVEIRRLAEVDQPDPILVLDHRGGALSVRSVSGARQSAPGSSVIVVTDGSIPAAPFFRAGAIAVVPAEPEAVAACVNTLIGGGAHSRGARGKKGEGEDLAKLKQVYGNLRSSLVSATVSVELMRIISESLDRAVLFLVRSGYLVGLGAFGFSPDGRSLAEQVQGLKLPIDNSELVRKVIEEERPRLLSDPSALPGSFLSRVGPARSGEYLLLPIRGKDRVLLLVYADNGQTGRPIEGLDFIELVGEQVGLALENELLARRMSATA